MNRDYLFHYDESAAFDAFLGELGVEEVNAMTPAQRAEAVGYETRVDLEAAIDENRDALTRSIRRACDDGAFAQLLDLLDLNYTTLPGDVRAAYDVCLEDIDRAGVEIAERRVVQSNREARGLK